MKLTTTSIAPTTEQDKQNFINNTLLPFKERFNTSSPSVEAVSIKDSRVNGAMMCIPEYISLGISDMGYKYVAKGFWEAPDVNALEMGDNTMFMGDLEFVYVFVNGVEKHNMEELRNEIEKQFNRPYKLNWMM